MIGALEDEESVMREAAMAAGAEGAYCSDVWARGGEGGAELAQAVVDAARDHLSDLSLELQAQGLLDGEPGRVIVGGVVDVPGASMFEKMKYFDGALPAC